MNHKFIFYTQMLMLLSACGMPPGDETPLAIDCSREPALDWHNYGQGFILQNCAACHHSMLKPEERNGAPPGVDFETYAQVLDFAERIHIRTLDPDWPMPPGGGLTDGDLMIFDEWMRCQVAADLAYVEEHGP